MDRAGLSKTSYRPDRMYLGLQAERHLPGFEHRNSDCECVDVDLRTFVFCVSLDVKIAQDQSSSIGFVHDHLAVCTYVEICAVQGGFALDDVPPPPQGLWKRRTS